MSRRKFLRQAALAVATVSGWMAPLYGAVRDGLNPSPELQRTLSTEQEELLATIAELIIPTTDTPGARAAGVGNFIGRMFSNAFSSERRERFLLALVDVEARALVHGPTFAAIAPDRKLEILRELEKEAIAARPMGTGKAPFFDEMRNLTLVGYYTSEVGATQELRYGGGVGFFDGDVPFEKIGRAYS